MQANRRRRRIAPVGAVLLALLVAACGDDGEPTTPAASEPASVTTEEPTSTTEALTPEEEVEAAYLRSWEVYAKAVRDLDPSGLKESYADEALRLVKDEIEELRSAGHAVEVRVEHNILNIQLIDDELGAVVDDEYLNHSVLVDPETSEPLEADPNEKLHESYQLKEIDGAWKVVAIVRQSG